MSSGEKYELIIFVGVFLLSLAGGLLAGDILLFSVLGLLAYLAWHLYGLVRLSRLLRRRQSIHSPYPPGLWGEIYRALEQTQVIERHHKRRLARLLSRFRIAAAEMPDGLVMLDQDQRIDWANPAAGTLLKIGFPADRGKRILELLRYQFLQEYLFAADFSRPMEFPSPDHSGMVISLQFIPFNEGKRSGLLLVARDITQTFNLNQIRKDFVANVSHELKTPLTVITGFVENLIDTEKLPRQERPLELMQQQASRMESTINDLLALSRLEMEQGSRTPEMVSVPGLLGELIEDARNLSGNQNHRFLTEIDPVLGLMGNEPELRGVFSNLIFNAVKHTPPRAEIRISWKFEDRNARFMVKDSGEGIAARHIPRLVERFYRVDPGRSSQFGGTGLGLAIVKHGVARQGGELDIQSKVGMGSTFRCDFPEGMFCFVP